MIVQNQKGGSILMSVLKHSPVNRFQQTLPAFPLPP